MATSVQSEDCIFLLDTSNSMFRNDTGTKNRFMQSLYAIEQIIQKKIEIDAKDRYSIVLFNSKVSSMDNMVFTSQEVMEYLNSHAEFSAETSLGEGLSTAVQLILKQLRFIGEKLDRIIILSDGKAQMSEINPINVAKIAKQLGIYIDTIRFGPAQIPGNLLKKLSEITSGDYVYISSEKDLDGAVKQLAQKKEKKHSTIFDKSDESDIMTQEFLGEIADFPLKLEDMTQNQKDQSVFQSDKTKGIICTICYQNQCMVDKNDFFGCGRFCPNCLTPFHLHCAKMWSEQQNKKAGALSTKIFRCPHCFYLMKIPNQNVEKTSNELSIGKEAALNRIIYDPLKHKDAMCYASNTPIDKNETPEIYECNSCGATYKPDIALEMWNKTKRCAYCNKLVSFQQ